MKQKTRILIYILIGIAVVIIGTIAILTNHQSGASVSAQEKIDLGRTYLLELSYDKALIEFTEAIEIDPTNPDAYLGLAEAYVGLDDTDSAIEALTEGYSITNDVRIKNMLDELIPPDVEETTVATTSTEIITTTSATSETTTVLITEIINVPDLSGLSRAEAVSICEEAGISYEIKISESDDIEKGYVVSQSEFNDDTLPNGHYVSIVVSSGAKDIAVTENATINEVTTVNETIITTTVEITTVPTETTTSSATTITTEKPDDGFIIIKGRKYSTDLTELNLSSKGLTNEDIEPLNKMKKLTYLTLYSNKISDVSVLSELTNLTELNLNANQIDNIDALSNLTNLEKLNLGVNQISDINALSNLTNLIDLDIWGNKISNISPLANLTGLKKLSLDTNEISDISSLSSLTDLTHLHLGHNKINNLDALSNLTNLKAITGLDSIDITADDVRKVRREHPGCSTDGDWKLTFAALN